MKVTKKREWKHRIALGGAVIAVVMAYVAYINTTTDYVKPSKLVYDVCQQSRISPNINEAGCGALQDQLGFEYLCVANNMLPDNKCWVEKKQ